MPLSPGGDPAIEREKLQCALRPGHGRDPLHDGWRDVEGTVVEPVLRTHPIRGQESVVVSLPREGFELRAGFVRGTCRFQRAGAPVSPPLPLELFPGHRRDGFENPFPPRMKHRGRGAPPQHVSVGIRGVDLPQPVDCPRLVTARKRQPDTSRDRGARLGAEIESCLHLRERPDRGSRVAAGQANEAVHEDGLDPRGLALEPHRAHDVRALVHRTPRDRETAVTRVHEALEITGEPRIASVHREAEPFPCQRRGESIRFEPHLEHRIARFRARLPRHPQPSRLGQCAGLVSGLEQCAGMKTLEVDRVAPGIPLEELVPLTAPGELAQPSLLEQEGHRLPVVTLEERLDLGRGDPRQVAAQPRKLDVGKQRVVAENAAQPFPCGATDRRRPFRFEERGSARGVRHRGAGHAHGEPRRADRPDDQE